MSASVIQVALYQYVVLGHNGLTRHVYLPKYVVLGQNWLARHVSQYVVMGISSGLTREDTVVSQHVPRVGWHAADSP